MRQGSWHQGHALSLSCKPGQKPKWTWNFELWEPVNELCFSFLHKSQVPCHMQQDPWILTSICAISVTENVSLLLWLEHLPVLLSAVFSDSCEHSSPWPLIQPGTICPPWFTHLLPQQPQSRDHVLLPYLWCLTKYLVYESLIKWFPRDSLNEQMKYKQEAQYQDIRRQRRKVNKGQMSA